MSVQWWRDAVIYQVYPKSFADADGDGVGDLPGITAHLDHLAALGVDAVWISPFYPSPQRDGGYDVANYRDVDPMFGTLADFDALIARAHELSLKVMVDIVPNHTSSAHPWFQAALASEPGSRARGRYLFRDGRGPNGDEPPNNWKAAFTGPSWTRVTEPDGRPGQWYLHLFDSSQPDLDWENPEVVEEFDAILRFWLDRGVDGFRVDVAIGMFKEDGLPDWDGSHWYSSDVEGPHPMWDRDRVHDIYRRWRRILDSYYPPRIMAGESAVPHAERLALYTRPDEMHQAMNFPFLWLRPVASEVAAVIDRTLATAGSAPSTWVLSNHDVRRPVTRFGSEDPWVHADRVTPTDRALGSRVALAMDALMLALPGSAYLYQGQELGLPDNDEIPDQARQDPVFLNSGGTVIGRDGCRVPMPWTPDGPTFGFNATGDAWLPMPAEYGARSVAAQEGVPGSTLEVYRQLLRLRRARALGHGRLVRHASMGGDVVAYVNESANVRTLLLVNLGPSPVAIPAGAETLIRTDGGDGPLAGYSAGWFAVA